MDTQNIPQLKMGYLPDVLRDGFKSVKSEATLRHPVERIQRTYPQMTEDRKKSMMAAVYGVHLPLRQRMEEEILSQFRRLPTLDTSFVGLDTVLGRDEDFGFEDYLGDPGMAEVAPPQLHDLMEARLGITCKRLV